MQPPNMTWRRFRQDCPVVVCRGNLESDLRHFRKRFQQAGITGINQAYLSLYANGKYNLDTLEKRRIANALKLPVDEVFTY